MKLEGVYTRFLHDRDKMTSMLKSGERTHKQLLDNLSKRFTLTDTDINLINGLDKSPQEQTVDEWLAEYSIN